MGSKATRFDSGSTDGAPQHNRVSKAAGVHTVNTPWTDYAAKSAARLTSHSVELAASPDSDYDHAPPEMHPKDDNGNLRIKGGSTDAQGSPDGDYRNEEHYCDSPSIFLARQRRNSHTVYSSGIIENPCRTVRVRVETPRTFLSRLLPYR
ncbi:uncharacterized protein ARMOST_19003 [Armillaria ostoyae]|uniref:Uncharacterized protein n=1 Tax=Armillaria ostoyae TaxID=47428 RepID=A0A284S3A5_ARMOS|nr:uncharacterized protein ARMOST_19003 [Armillaria ostoyae]